MPVKGEVPSARGIVRTRKISGSALRRFKQRLDDPARHWKISESDYTERKLWPEYQKAYEDAISSAEFGGYEEAVTKYKERLEAIKTIQCQP